MAFVAELVLGRRFLWYVVPLAIVLALFVWRGSWSWQENLPSILGLVMLAAPAALLFGTSRALDAVVATSLVAPGARPRPITRCWQLRRSRCWGPACRRMSGISIQRCARRGLDETRSGCQPGDGNRRVRVGSAPLSIALLVLAATVFLPAGLI